jgi:glutathione S-transferase
MELVAVVATLALIEYVVILMRTGQARGRFDVPAPATTGHPIFERHFRVQENTIEQLVIFFPSLFLFSTYVSPGIAALLGLGFIAGRALYARAYVEDPAKRGPGFMLSFLSNLVLLVGGMLGALVAWL